MLLRSFNKLLHSFNKQLRLSNKHLRRFLLNDARRAAAAPDAVFAGVGDCERSTRKFADEARAVALGAVSAAHFARGVRARITSIMRVPKIF
jgi:hypothetical protein